jgi:hypothetical protein
MTTSVGRVGLMAALLLGIAKRIREIILRILVKRV